ncbi:restriction endonuclease subunit S [Actinomadura sp. K4S16]|uniref:restriction endonuclease subunit S n=1 Tax=Actinomadura sp. K4S16 TaxID=1316147 RepID=UPI00135CC234|nr:restriction endonuclease subunit S [Actinomadura sp. K4S16]
MSIQERPLGEVISLATTEERVADDQSYPIAGVYGFGRGLFKRGPIQGRETSYKKLNRLTEGRLVMSRLKAFEGAISLISAEFDGWYLSPEFPTFAIDDTRADSRYLANICAWPEFWERLRAQSKGIGARKERVSAERLLSVNIPLPSPAEQRRIAARLDSAMQKLSLIQKKRDFTEDLHNALRDSVIHKEESSKSTRLGDILSLERIPLEVDPEREYTQIGVRSFGNGIFHRDKLPGRELSKLKYFWIQPDRLIVSNIMAWEGAIAISTEADKDCVGSSRFLSFTPSDNVDLRYLNYYFQSRSGQGIIRNTSTGTVLRNQTLSINKFNNISIPLPTPSRQHQIANFLDESTKMRKLAQTQKPTTSALQQSLLNAAFSGKL